MFKRNQSEAKNKTPDWATKDEQISSRLLKAVEKFPGMTQDTINEIKQGILEGVAEASENQNLTAQLVGILKKHGIELTENDIDNLLKINY